MINLLRNISMMNLKNLINKFIEYLPDENCGKLKMDILFDKNGLIDLCNNNIIYFMNNNEFFKYISKSKSKTKNNDEN